MQWIADKDPTSNCVARSTDGRYRVTIHYGGAEFLAWHVPAPQAKPLEIGARETLEDAQEFCDEHACRPQATTN